MQAGELCDLCHHTLLQPHVGEIGTTLLEETSEQAAVPGQTLCLFGSGPQ